MRILIATTHQAVVGGVETYLRAVCPLIRSRGHEVGLLAAYPASAAQPTIDADCPGVEVLPNDLTAATNWRPDVVYSHEWPDIADEEILTRQFPVVYFAHNYSGMCISGSKCHASPAWQPCDRRLGPGCLGRFFLRRCGGLNPVNTLRLYRANRTRQRQLSEYRAVVVASRHMATEVIRNGVPPDRVHLTPLFPPGVQPDPTPPIPRSRTDRVLFVGRLTAIKGWRELIGAVSAVSADLGRRLTLVVAGEGPDRDACEMEARCRNVPVELLGWVDPSRREMEMRRADVLVVPSVWPEPFGLVGIEAGCVGLPAVAFALGGIPDWLKPGVSGELAPGERPGVHGLATALIHAIRDDEHHHQLRIGAWEVARQFSPEAHLNQLLSVLEAVART